MVVRGAIADASVLLPVLATDVPSHDISKLIYNGLTRRNKDIELVPDLAERWEISEDNLRIRFFLRKGVRWHDGHRFTAEDVRYTYEVYIDPKTPTAYASGFLKVKTFRVLDEHTVEVVYHEPYAPALETWARAILPSHLLKGKKVTDSPLRTHPVGTGPYRFVEWRTGEKLVLEASETYFRGTPFVDRYITRVIPDPATMFLELKSGSLDWMELTPLQFNRQTASKWFGREFNKHRYLDNSYTYLGYNLEDPKFTDVRVRQALTMAIDREGILNGVLLGLGKIAHSPYRPDTYWYNPGLKKWPYDPDRAIKLLDKAGWRDTDGDGVRDRKGMPLKFTILTNQGNALRRRAATIIQRDLTRVGVDVSIREVEWAAFIKNFIHKRNFEVCLLGWASRITFDPDQTTVWHSSQTGPNQLNFVSYQNKRVDRLLELGVSTFDRKKRKKYYDEMQNIIAEEQPYTFLWIPPVLPAIHSRIHGIRPAPLGIDYNFEQWFIPAHLQEYGLTP